MLLVIFYDFIYTIFIPKGAGPITQFITLSLARLFKIFIYRKGSNSLVDFQAPVIIVFMMLVWVLVVWLGVALIMSSDYDSIVRNDSEIPATFAQKLYFTGYVLSTMGLGDYKPNGIVWQLYSSLMSAMGFAMLTTSVAYFVPVIHNIIQKNTLTLSIASLGESPNEILINGYNGKDFSDLEQPFLNLTLSIFQYAKNHAAYPILHHVQSSDVTENVNIKLAALDEVCTILLFYIPEKASMKKVNLMGVRRAITYYLQSIRYVKASEKTPPMPDILNLSHVLGLKIKNDSPHDMQTIYLRLQHRRRLFKGIIEDDGFSWDDINNESKGSQLDIALISKPT
jgi:hypothetical protein